MNMQTGITYDYRGLNSLVSTLLFELMLLYDIVCCIFNNHVTDFICDVISNLQTCDLHAKICRAGRLETIYPDVKGFFCVCFI